MLSEKYVVVKTEDWVALTTALQTGRCEEALQHACSAPLAGDYFVIREQDVFGAQGLYAYAANIRTAVEFTQSTGLSVMTQATERHLMDLADDLVETGAVWQERQQSVSSSYAKIPD